MSYPQPNSNTPVIQGADFFRILTPLTSQGDIYSSEVSGSVFQVGPDSDIARVNVTYFDDAVANKTNNITISNKTPFYGRLNARNDAPYQPSQVPGRILFSPADIVPNLTSALNTQIVAPTFDVIEYFSPRTITPLRNDKDFPFYDFPYSGGSFIIYLPCYGRSYVEIQSRDPGGTGAALAIDGLKWGLGSSATQTTALRASGAIGAGVQVIVRSAANGFYDHIRLTFSGGTGLALPTRVIMSDVPQ